MERQMKNANSSMKVYASILSAAGMLVVAGPAAAQNASGRVSVHLPGGMEATVFASVPEDFEPDLASDTELLEYGYPQRPDVTNSEALALWERAVHTTRVSTDLVESPGIFHRPVQQLQKSTNATATSGNWSAVVVDGTSADFDDIDAFWAVPNVASQVAKTANGYSSMWVGLDGDGTQDLIQDGTSSQWVGGKAVYNAWVEVLPAAETVVTGLTINPGDAIYAVTEYKVVNGKASAFFYMSNLNTVKNISVSIAFPTDLKYTGQTAEWVVERTDVNGSFENPMPNYGLGFMSAAYASRTGSSTLYPANGTPSSVGTTIYVSMYDTPTKKTLSTPAPQGVDSITFQWDAY
jgi:hypothetical protein